jgi:hypothetical protein
MQERSRTYVCGGYEIPIRLDCPHQVVKLAGHGGCICWTIISVDSSLASLTAVAPFIVVVERPYPSPSHAVTRQLLRSFLGHLYQRRPKYYVSSAHFDLACVIITRTGRSRLQMAFSLQDHFTNLPDEEGES